VSTIATLRQNVLNAIASVLPFGTEIIEARVPATSFALAVRQPCVVVSYAGSPKKEPGPVGKRGVHGYVWVFTIAIVEADWQTPAGAAYKAADIGALLRGEPSLPDTTPNLQTICLGNVRGEDVYLTFVSEAPEIDPGGTAQGGKFALVQQYETNEVRF
jgi:hypothetical protein